MQKHSSVPALKVACSEHYGVSITRIVNKNNPPCAELGQAQASGNHLEAIMHRAIQDRWELTETQISMVSTKLKKLNKSRDSIRIRA